MIELVVLDYLKSVLNVPVAMEKPTADLKEYVLIEKTGSSEENYIMNATFVIQSYSDTLYGAASLNETVKEKMRNITTLADVSASKLNSDYNYTDTTTKQYRYQAVFDLVF